MNVSKNSIHTLFYSMGMNDSHIYFYMRKFGYDYDEFTYISFETIKCVIKSEFPKAYVN